MVSGSYSFIDIAVLDQVRTRLAAGDALAMLDVRLESLIWANGPGCQLFGYDDVETVMGAPSGLSPVAKRQISAAPGFPRMRGEVSVTVRMGGVRPVGLVVSGVTLPDGEPAVLIALPANHGASRPPDDIARQAVSGFGDANSYAALIDEQGRVEASSTGFDALGIGAETLEALVAEVRDEEDRLVKRLIPATAATLAAGMARLTEEPARHLLLVIEAEEAEMPEEAEPEPGQSSPAASLLESLPQDDAVEDDPMPEAEAVDDAEDAETVLAQEPVGAAEDLPDNDIDEPGNSEQMLATPEQEASNSLLAPQGDDDAPAEATADPVASTQNEPLDQEPSPILTPPPPAAATETPQPARNGVVRFVWRTDADGRFTSVSDEFAAAVGASVESFNGRTFSDVATHFGLDGSGEVADLLERRDTWSGRTVIWPIVGSGLGVPVDLAALPIYDRARNFEGFRGFGVARMGDAAAFSPAENQPALPVDEAVEDAATEIDEDPFQGEAPALAVKPGPERRQSDKIIRLAEHRPANGAGANADEEQDSGLSASERSAFRQIGERLKRDSDAGPSDDLKPVDAPAGDIPDVAPMPQEPAAQAAEPPAPQDEVAAPPEAVDGQEEKPTDAPVAETVEMPAAPEDQEPPAPPVEAETIEEDREPAPVAKFSDIKAVLARADRDFRPAAYPAAPADEQASPTAILGGLPLAVLVHAGDTLHFANREFFKLTGYQSLEAIAAAGGLDSLFAEGSEPRGASGGSLSLRRADGTARDVTAHLHSIAWKGSKALILALQPVAEPGAPVSEDEDELRDRLYELRAIVDTATDGVVLIDKAGFIRSISRPAEALFGMDSKQVEGKSFVTLFAIESQRAAGDYLAGLADNGVASVLNDGREVIGREAQGRFIPLFMTMGRLPADSGYCAVLRDITHWKRAEEELTQARAQAERASLQKTEFLARVSHEVRTPLNAIIGFSELMLDEKFGPIGNERYRDYLRDINRSGNHVLDLVNDLLDISKIEAGEQEMSYEAVSLNDSLAETVAMMQPQANRERVIIRSSFASRLPDVVADQRSVRQIALNLLSNAVRATPAGGRVIVSTAYEQSGDIVLRVRDTGIGMTIAEIEQALKPFKQINALKRARGEGTGLGLPLTKALVEANRARFHITSSPGQGTMVEITFPATRVLAV